MTRTRGLRFRTAVASALLAVIVGTAFAVLIVAIGNLRAAGEQARDRQLEIAAANRLELLALDLQTGQRGYVIAQNPDFLRPWETAERAYPGLARTLERLAADDPVQLGRAQAIAASIRRYDTQWTRRVIRIASIDPTRARALVATGRGNRLVEAIRKQFQSFSDQAQQQASLDRASSDQRGALAVALAAACLGGSVLLALLFASYLSRLVVDPVRRLLGATRRLSDGDLAMRVPEVGSAELVQLAQSFNSMAASLETGQARLRDRNSELEAVLDAANDGICMVDLDGNLVLANRAMDRFWAELGLEASGSIWERVAALAFRTQDPEGYVAEFGEIAEDPEREFGDEFLICDLDRVFVGYTGPVRDGSGALVGRIFTVREVTSERAVERLKDEFVATVSHELRTPLTSIIGYLELVMDGEAGGLTGEQRSFLSVVERNANRLLTLVGDLLFVARAEGGSLALERGPVDLAQLAADCVSAVRPLAEEKRLELTVDAQPVSDLWGDGQRLGQLLDNLLANAVKFTPAGGRVALRVRAERDRATIEVEDTGIGIAAADRDRLFERFYRGATAGEQQIPGTGLGLSICRTIAERHGGVIDFDSVEGEGSTFRVELPIRARRELGAAA